MHLQSLAVHRLRFGWKGNGVAVAIVIGYRMCNGVACTVTCRKRPHDVGKPLCFLLLSSRFPWIIEPCIGILPSQPLLQCRGMLLCVVPDMTVCCSNIAHTDLISVALYTVPYCTKFIQIWLFQCNSSQQSAFVICAGEPCQSIEPMPCSVS